LLIAEEWGPPTGIIAVHWHVVLTDDLKIGWISALLVDPERRETVSPGACSGRTARASRAWTRRFNKIG
jgi:hypothetical protein